jgi:hypothetical protein
MIATALKDIVESDLQALVEASHQEGRISHRGTSIPALSGHGLAPC